MDGTTAVAISGGVDSLTAAWFLKEKGRQVVGIHFLTGFETDTESSVAGDIEKQLGIPVHVVDCSEAFESKIVAYFMQTYMDGKTPNPCLVCNPLIKFGEILSIAKKFGASKLATGHYARISVNSAGLMELKKGIDPKKDQSYFLAFLSKRQLSDACFPLGAYTKAEVKKIAAENGLKPATAGESQDICFIRGKSYGEFLARRNGFRPKPGGIENTDGEVIGEHRGLHLFTVGQRRGIDCPASQAYYVVRIDVKRNRLIVGFKNELFSKACRVTGINWITKPPEAPFRAEVRVRYRHRAVPATVVSEGENTATVTFDIPESAVTPGQGAVFYDGDSVIGGGWIECS